jgi:hypothetical protein
VRTVFAVSLLLSVEHGLPSLDRQVEQPLPEPRCVVWNLPVIELGEVVEHPLICCFQKPEAKRRVCVPMQPKF